MELGEFVNKIRKWYDKPIKGTHAICKFYMQAQTFSFELHDQREDCFTPLSLKFESDVYAFYGDTKVRNKIIKDIKENSIKLLKK